MLNGLEDLCAALTAREWKRVRFGDVVESLNETRARPGRGWRSTDSLGWSIWSRVHCTSGCGATWQDGTTFTRRCRPGQVLFGKRRAYQRKVAVAEFDAVVSGDIYVFAPKNDRLLPEFLPFLCMSERFFMIRGRDFGRLALASHQLESACPI